MDIIISVVVGIIIGIVAMYFYGRNNTKKLLKIIEDEREITDKLLDEE